MSAAVKLTRLDHTTAEFRQAAAACADSDAARRMLTLAIVREGGSRADAARLCGMDRQTLRDWVHRYNELGLVGLSDKAGRRCPKPRLSTDQARLVAEMVRKGPDLAEDGVVRWRRIDLARSIQAKLGVGSPSAPWARYCAAAARNISGQAMISKPPE
jgi:transposase